MNMKQKKKADENSKKKITTAYKTRYKNKSKVKTMLLDLKIYICAYV